MKWVAGSIPPPYFKTYTDKKPLEFNWKSIQGGLDAKKWMEFAFFAAHVQHILQLFDRQEQLNLFKQTMEFERGQSAVNLSDALATGCSKQLEIMLRQPAFIVTFHIGFYRTIPVSLLSMGYRVALLVSQEIFENQQVFYRQVLRPAWFANLTFVPAEDPQVFFKLRKLRNQGYQVLCYVDGGTGTQRQYQAQGKRLDLTDLGTARLPARSGFAEMAYLLQAPLCLLMPPAQRSRLSWQLDMDAVWLPADYSSRKTYVQTVMAQLYAQLSEVLQKTPHVWECWFYLHHSMPPISDIDRWSVAERWVPFRRQGQAFLLDKGRYKIYPLADDKLKKISTFL